MSDLQYNLQFDKLCNILQLGEIISVPEAISGGLLHRMYAIETTQGKYAIKALNPQIMTRPTALQNYINSELIANIAAKNVPALPAKIINGTFLQKFDNQFYLVFDWVDGRSLKANEINVAHCKKIGSLLATIHMTDFSDAGIANLCSENAQLTDWNFYLQKGQEMNSVWIELMFENIDKLYSWDEQVNKSSRLLATDMVISHRDLDCKNVLWSQNNPIIIDWEAAGYINPMHELIETAIYWSENESGNIDTERFLAFINAYKKRYGTLQANWSIFLANGFSGKLGWLEYNLKRSLQIECTDEEEQQLGTAQVTVTINAIRRYSDMISELEVMLFNNV